MRGGRSGVRAILFVVADVVRRYDPDFADCHRRLTQAGKPKKLIRVALARKLLVRLNAKARDVRRQLANASWRMIAWLGENAVGSAVMEASGGYERGWAKALREAGIAVRIVDPKRVRYFAKSAGRLAKNDPIDAEMIAWFAETFAAAGRRSRSRGA